MKTSELTGAALDWAVAKCEGLKTQVKIEGIVWLVDSRGDISRNYNPSSNWSWGGPIIEREKITTTPVNGWQAGLTSGGIFYTSGPTSPTPLVAAMRCYVASKLGDAVEIPEELK